MLRRACGRELPDAELMRFLRAKEWDIKRAAAAVRTTVAWRRERSEALRQLRSEPALSRCMALMGTDVCGWPVYCLRPGQLQPASIGQEPVTTEVISAQAVVGYEALRRLLRMHQADATGLTLLLDMREVTMALLWAVGLRLVRELVEVGTAHYPDLLRTVLIFSPVTEDSYILPQASPIFPVPMAVTSVPSCLEPCPPRGIARPAECRGLGPPPCSPPRQITALMRPLIADATRTRVHVIREVRARPAGRARARSFPSAAAGPRAAPCPRGAHPRRTAARRAAWPPRCRRAPRTPRRPPPRSRRARGARPAWRRWQVWLDGCGPTGVAGRVREGCGAGARAGAHVRAPLGAPPFAGWVVLG